MFYFCVTDKKKSPAMQGEGRFLFTVLPYLFRKGRNAFKLSCSAQPASAKSATKSAVHSSIFFDVTSTPYLLNGSISGETYFSSLPQPLNNADLGNLAVQQRRYRHSKEDKERINHQHGPHDKAIGEEPNPAGNPFYNYHRKQNAKNG